MVSSIGKSGALSNFVIGRDPEFGYVLALTWAREPKIGQIFKWTHTSPEFFAYQIFEPVFLVECHKTYFLSLGVIQN